MAKDKAYRNAEKKIEEARRSGATELRLHGMKLTELPESIGQLTKLQSLDISKNQLSELSESIGQLTQLQRLELYDNQLTSLPKLFEKLINLHHLDLYQNKIAALPRVIFRLPKLRELGIGHNPPTILSPNLFEIKNITNLGLAGLEINDVSQQIKNLRHLKMLYLEKNNLTDLPPSLAQLEHLKELKLGENPLNPELAAANKEGFDAVMAYLRAKAEEQVVLNEAKLILVGEGEVGKSCLMDALRGEPWQEHDTTHGIEINPVNVLDEKSQTEITLNGWDFGGQRVYRPTHQLFFSSPAVYLVVWKPREGPQQGFVNEWIKLIKHREPDAKILVVATHGGPGARQPDIDRQELWDLFGTETVLDFFFVDSKPDENGQRHGIDALKDAIARTAVQLPEVGRSVPKRWQDVRNLLEAHPSAYLPRQKVLELCAEQGMDADESQLFLTLEHRLGHLIHYAHDKALQDIVVLKPSWLATAISFVLDDKKTRDAHGLVRIRGGSGLLLC